MKNLNNYVILEFTESIETQKSLMTVTEGKPCIKCKKRYTDLIECMGDLMTEYYCKKCYWELLEGRND